MSKVYLVESIPSDLVGVGLAPRTRPTGPALVALTDAAKESIRITVMYWSLTPDPTSADENGFTPQKLDDLGGTQGKALLTALRNAAGRGVQIWILQDAVFGKNNADVEKLKNDFEGYVHVVPLEMKPWFGGGIMHEKMWIFDECSLYIGSANMDWRSLTQVKEMGIVVEDAPELARDAKRQFDALRELASLEVTTAIAWDPDVRIERPVPAWSELIEAGKRANSPFDGEKYATAYNRETPLNLTVDERPSDFYISAGPPEVKGRGRTDDAVALVSTVDDALRSVCVNVMDLAPTGLFGEPHDARIHEPSSRFSAPVWWPKLWDALLRAASTRRCWVRVLVSKWAHSSGAIEPYLRALQQAADAARGDFFMMGGSLEVRLFTMPGWDSTSLVGSRKYPDHTRVNHAKYIVTDRRANIGTSNMSWDYFSQTAGASLNTSHPNVVADLQAAFDRDWTSRYAVPPPVPPSDKP
jgi:phospholipase D3/4